MEDTQLFANNEIRNSLFAVASSILTELLYDELSNIHYEVQNTGQGVMLIQVDEHGLFWKLMFIIGIFLSIWALISVVIPILIRFLGRFRYRNVKTYTTEFVVANYRNVKANIIKLSKINSNQFNLLYINEIATTINQLYAIFCPDQKRNKRVVTSSFRDGVTVDNMESRISPYEYQIMINQAESLLEIFPTIQGHPMADNDYEMLKKRLDRLKNIKIA